MIRFKSSRDKGGTKKMTKLDKPTISNYPSLPGGRDKVKASKDPGDGTKRPLGGGYCPACNKWAPR